MNAVTRFTLDNGLRVVHRYDPLTAMANINVVYDVGARDEARHLTGMAHLFEHLMFSGSINIPRFDEAIERAGGFNNAWTSQDFTSFYSSAPAVNVETLFWLESDRMLGLNFSQENLDVQRSVVIEEFKQVCLNRPYGTVSHHLNKMLYGDHPYSVPVIGRSIEELEHVTLDDIRNFFFSHYAPNNAVLSIDGNITLDRARSLTEKYFGPISRREIAPRIHPSPEPLTHPVREQMQGLGAQTMVMIAFPMGDINSPEFIPLDLVSDIMASGDSSRLLRNLVMRGDLFSKADASIAGTVEEGYFLLRGLLLEDSPQAVERAEKELIAEAVKIADSGVTDFELQRALNRYESNNTFSQINSLERCRQTADAEIRGQRLEDMVGIYRRTTTQQLQQAAKKTFDTQRTAILVHRPLQ